EPELLRVDAERIRRQMQEVAVTNYRSFISAADALIAIREEVTFIDKHLEAMIFQMSVLISIKLKLDVLNLFSKNMSTAVENFQLVLDSHRWVPLPAVGFPANTVGEESQEDVTPPSYLMEHPPLAVFIN
ncbi:hypothetical protein S245_069994, partial [Arachis hypogaea]